MIPYPRSPVLYETARAANSLQDRPRLRVYDGPVNRKDLLSAAGAASLASLAVPALSATSETSRPLKSSRDRPLVVAAIGGRLERRFVRSIYDFGFPRASEHTARKIAWIREASETADVVMSVCTGAFLLAKTGLIDGMIATTHHAYLDDFAKRFPQIRLNRTARYVENPGGKFCSAGGIASGIELALRVVERYFGENTPARTAYYMEYTRSLNRPTT